MRGLFQFIEQFMRNLAFRDFAPGEKMLRIEMFLVIHQEPIRMAAAFRYTRIGRLKVDGHWGGLCGLFVWREKDATLFSVIDVSY